MEQPCQKPSRLAEALCTAMSSQELTAVDNPTVELNNPRHLPSDSQSSTNQRTDAVAMSVLDRFEVFEIQVYPFEGVKARNSEGLRNPDYEYAKAYLDALEYWVHQKAIRESKYGAILNEKDPLTPTVRVNPPPPLRGQIVSTK
jgi:hypothetical protein